MVAPSPFAVTLVMFVFSDSQSVEIFDELEKIEELLERASEELEIWSELLETFSLELLSLKLDELDCAKLELETLLDDIALLELFFAEELLGSSELEEIDSLEELTGKFIAEKFCMFPERSNPERTCMASLK